MNYADVFWITNSKSRLVLRSGGNANANSGLVYADANNAGTHSYANCGVRLAFRGAIVFVTSASESEIA